jgi:amidohydrolase
MSSKLEGATVLDRARAMAPAISELRRKIHANPELSFQESETAKLVCAVLRKAGYDVRPGVGGTGVVAEIGSGRTIAIRADMDALPIQETNGVDYCSRNENVMHACGHDAHTACALGAAQLIAENYAGDSPPAGCVRFVFQPAEEKVNDDGKSGAGLMIEQGAMDGAEGVLALHVFPNLPVGCIAAKDGPLLAACDSFDIKIKGAGCHGAYPQHGVDAIVVASHVVQAIQTIVSRRKSALDPAVITLGGIRSTTYAHNIVAEEVELRGTVRYFDNNLHTLLKAEIEKACRLAEALGGSYELNYVQDNPPLVNDSQLTNVVRAVARRLLGKDSVLEATLEMGADDFSFLSQHSPGCYFLLGAQIDEGPRVLHTSTFDINEEALPIGAAMLAAAALQFLG